MQRTPKALGHGTRPTARLRLAHSLAAVKVRRLACPQTLGAKTVLVYDSNKFPFYPGELYHQFHVSSA